MLKAKSLMKTSVISVKTDTTIDEVISLLAKNNITGLPVVDDDMTLIGVVTEKDVLKLLSDHNLVATLPDLEASSVKVSEFMTTEVTTFNQDADLVDICDCLVQNNFRRVPILTDGKLAGIISRKDIIAVIS